MRFVFIICLGWIISNSLLSQVLIREDEELLNKLKSCLYSIYNYDFENADATIEWVEQTAGNHPVVPFLKGLRLYWSYNPLTNESKDVQEFISLMEQCMEESDSILKAKPDDLEGTFFSLVSRAMLMLHYADNEMSYKVIPYANEAYKHTLAGFDMKDEFNEFYFVSGLYKYYRVAYPEAHPVYKPLLVIFKAGNKEEGINEMKYAIENAIYMRVEAMLYLSYIYLHYENDPVNALVLAEKLYNEFPENRYFISRYTELLLLNNKYKEAIPYVKILIEGKKDDLYSTMKGMIFKALIEEKYNMDPEKAKENYETGLQLAEEYKSWGTLYKCYAYIGLSRIAMTKGDETSKKSYDKWVKKNTPYEFVKLWD